MNLVAPRSNHAQRSLCAFALTVITLPIAAEIVEFDLAGSHPFAHEFRLPAGKFSEACGSLAKGAAVQWCFNSSEPVDFNIHYHEGKTVLYPVKQPSSTVAQGTLEVTVDQTYCWMWTNKTALPANVSVQLSR